MSALLEEMFQRFAGAFRASGGEAETAHHTCSGSLSQAVEHVVDETYSRLRFLPGYAKRLREPVAAAFEYIDALVETFPGAFLCSRATFAEDPRVNAFFIDPRHLQEVFSHNAEVQELLATDPRAEECWALLCMRKLERRQLGMTLLGDAVQKEVMQTVVSFTDHRVFSPAISEKGARCSLKCCIFNSLLAFIRKRESDQKARLVELESRHRYLVGHRMQASPDAAGESEAALQSEIDALGKELAREVPRLSSLEEHLDLVAEVLGNPARYVSVHPSSIHVNRQGIKLEGAPRESGSEIPLFEILVASQGTRVGALVRFPRDELLPRQDFVGTADRYLTL